MGKERVLVEAKTVFPPETGDVRISDFRKGDSVRLTRMVVLESGDHLAVQRFPAGTIGELLGQDRDRFVVLIEGERWYAQPSDVRLVK